MLLNASFDDGDGSSVVVVVVAGKEFDDFGWIEFLIVSKSTPLAGSSGFVSTVLLALPFSISLVVRGVLVLVVSILSKPSNKNIFDATITTKAVKSPKVMLFIEKNKTIKIRTALPIIDEYKFRIILGLRTKITKRTKKRPINIFIFDTFVII